MKKNIGTLILLLLIVANSATLQAEGFSIFADQDLAELTLVAVDPASGTFTMLDRSGYEQDGSLGDFIGYQMEKVFEVREISIVVVVEEEYTLDWYGTPQTRTRTFSRTIPLARALSGGKGIR